MLKITKNMLFKKDREKELRERIDYLIEYIRQVGELTDICTYKFTKEICKGCQCGKNLKKSQEQAKYFTVESLKQTMDKLDKEKEERESFEQENYKLFESKDHQAKIHNEILGDLANKIYFTTSNIIKDKSFSEHLAKSIIKAICKGEIKNLKIIY